MNLADKLGRTIIHNLFNMQPVRRRLLKTACGCCALGFSPWQSLYAAPDDNVVKAARGTLMVNDVLVKAGHPLNFGDRLVTGPDSSAVVVFNQDAFQLRSLTRFRLPDRGPSSTIELDSGALLGAFLPGGERKVKVKAFTTLSIRGTGIYVGAQEDYVDFCLCYGGVSILTKTGELGLDTQSKFHQWRFIQQDGTVRHPSFTEFSPTHSSRQNVELEKVAGRASPFGGGFRDFLSIFGASEL